MIRFFKYYYFRMFEYFSNGDAIPIFSTFSVMFVFSYANIISILNLISTMTDIKVRLPTYMGIDRLLLGLLLVPIYAFFYYKIKNKNAHELILSEFSTQTKKQRMLGGWLVIFYHIASVLLFIGSLWLCKLPVKSDHSKVEFSC